MAKAGVAMLALLAVGAGAVLLATKKSSAAPSDPRNAPDCPPGYGLNNIGQCVPLVGPPLPPPPPPPLGTPTSAGDNTGGSTGPEGTPGNNTGFTDNTAGDTTAVTGFSPRRRGFGRRGAGY